MPAGSAHNARSPFHVGNRFDRISPMTSNGHAPHYRQRSAWFHAQSRFAVLVSSVLFIWPLAWPCNAQDVKPTTNTTTNSATAPSDTKEATERASETGPIRVIVAVPLTGARRTVGAAVRQRLSLVKSAIDAAGGVTRRELKLEFEDDACTREAARELATRITAMTPPPAAVIGHPCATASIAAAPLYQQAGVLFLAAGMRHPQLTEKRIGPLVFRAAGRDDRQGAEAGRRLHALAGNDRTALIINDRTVLTRALTKAASEAAAYGAKEAPTELTIISGETDYSKTIDEIARREPAAILFLGFPSEAAIILRQLRARGLQMPIIFNDAMASAEFIAHAGDLLESDVEVMMPISISRDALSESEMPDALVASDTAAALSVWADAVTATASTNALQIANNLSSPRSHIDEIGFDSAGDAVAPSFAPFRWRDNVWQRADLPQSPKGQ